MRLAINTPTCLITVKNTGILNVCSNLLVPLQQYIRHPVSHLNQAALRHSELKMKIEHLKNLRDRITQRKMQSGTQHHNSVTNRRFW